jgi:hypothetical protein
MYEILRAKGNAIARDWATEAGPRNYGENLERSAKLARAELKAVLDSTLFIHLSGMGGVGKYIELGAALASNDEFCIKTAHGYNDGMPFIYVAGQSANESQFHFNPAIKRIKTTDPVQALPAIIREAEDRLNAFPVAFEE